MPHQLVLATRNQGKVIEFRRILDQLAPGEIDLIGLDKFPDLIDVEETGLSFQENALLKARYAPNKIASASLASFKVLSGSG